MRKFTKVAGIFILLLFASALPAQAKKLDIRRLLQKAVAYDNTIVEIEAEAVGMLRRKNGVWLNISDGFSIGVWVEAGGKITLPSHFAGYYRQGDLLYIKGVFHAACPQHRGEADIHAVQIKILRPGGRRPEAVSSDKKIFAVIMLAVFIVCAMFFSYRQRLWKKRS